MVVSDKGNMKRVHAKQRVKIKTVHSVMMMWV
jgi:hypothetical protein